MEPVERATLWWFLGPALPTGLSQHSHSFLTGGKQTTARLTGLVSQHGLINTLLLDRAATCQT